MSEVLFEGTNVSLAPGESVLDALLRHGHDIPNGCRAGACQSCLMVSDSESLPANARQGLSDTQIALNHFLACQCKPSEPVKVSLASFEGLKTAGTLVAKDMLNQQVLRLRLSADLIYLAGQYVTLWNEQGIARSYSLASHPAQDDFLEFHIKVISDGAFSQWARDSLHVGGQVQVQGPMGKCVYAASAEQPLLLSAIGTGLAPIYGILKDALSQKHQGQIHLILGARESKSFYLVEELLKLGDEQANLQVHFVAQSSDQDFCQAADIYEFCQSELPDLTGFKVYLCGAESFVKKMRKQSFLSGAAMSDISADVFLPFGG
eukprot:g4293.t1